MKIPWDDNRCILCLKPGELTDEHVIPHALGGRLHARFLCKDCNDDLGRRVEAKVKTAPSIQLAIEQPALQIPSPTSKLREHQNYVVKSAGRKVRAHLKHGNLYIEPTRQPDGSLWYSTSDAHNHLKNILRKQGATNQEISDNLEKFDNASENESIQLGPSLRVTKWKIDSVDLALDGDLINNLVLLKIAFEFLAVHAGEQIYSNRPDLSEIRQILRGKKTASNSYTIERLGRKKYEPIHGLIVRTGEPNVVVDICLFGLSIFRVKFRDVALRGPRYSYTCDLESGEEFYEEIK